MLRALFSFDFHYKYGVYAFDFILCASLFCILSVLTRFFSGPMPLKDFIVNILTAIFGGYLWCLIVKFIDHLYYKQTNYLKKNW